MSRPCPTSSQCSGGTMHPDSSLGQPRGRRPPEGTWPSRGDRHDPVLAAQATLSCPSPCGVQSGFWELPRPLQVFAAQPPCARLASLWTGEGSEARGLFSVAFLAPSISLARGGVAGELGLKPENLRSGPGPWAVSAACFEPCHQVSRTSHSGCPADGEQLPPAAT